MKQTIRGMALMLLSLILIVGFNSVGWLYVFDLSVRWQHLFIIMGIIGFVMVLLGTRKES